jgi:phage shock protein PspC (stress-responsive transcriptional regulator)
MNLADDLQKLQTLREQGALTDEEFTLAKKRLLEGTPADARPKCAAAGRPASALRELRRSLTDRWIGGVCGGLADSTGIPSWSWRILFILTALLHGLGLVMYILLWIFVPLQREALPRPATPARD